MIDNTRPMGKAENIVVGQRLRQARKNAGLDVAAVAEATGFSVDTVKAHEKGARGVRQPVAQRYARLYGVEADWILGFKRAPLVVKDEVAAGMPVLGVVGAGLYREALTQADVDPERIPVQYDPAYGEAPQFALRVEGRSMDMVYPPGAYVIVVDAQHTEPRWGDHVVFERRQGGLSEYRLAELARDPKSGRTRLVPRSTDNRFQEPLEPRAGTVEVVAVVIGGFIRRGRRGPSAFA